MKYIEYNISSNKKLNYFRVILFSLIVFTFSTILINIGIKNISFLNSKTTEKQILIDKLRKYIDDFSDKETGIRETIRKNKVKWKPRIKFVNSLISRKTFSFIKRLNLIEKILPNEAYLKSLYIKYGSKNRIIVKVDTNSFNELLSVYKKFSKLELNYGKETIKNGKFSSIMSIIIRDE